MIHEFGVLPVVIAMNKERYEKLSPRAKAVIDKSGAMLARLQGEVFDSARANFIEQHEKDPKHTVLEPTAAEQREMETLFKPLHEKWKAEHGTERYDALVEILGDIRKGS